MAALFGAIRPALDGKAGVVVHLVAVTAGEGTSTLARAFAECAAGLDGRRILLVDADHGRQTSARALGIPMRNGLADAPEDEEDFGQVVSAAGEHNLWAALLAGSASAAAPTADAVSRLYDRARARFGLTVVDCPPIGEGGYCALAPEAADGIILVVQAEKVRPAVVVHARAVVEQAGGTFLGVVLNKRRSYIPNALYRVM